MTDSFAALTHVSRGRPIGEFLRQFFEPDLALGGGRVSEGVVV